MHGITVLRLRDAKLFDAFGIGGGCYDVFFYKRGILSGFIGRREIDETKVWFESFGSWKGISRFEE